jgi:glutathione S-transferase
MQINVDEEVFKVYAISIALLMAKTLMMALITARQRFKTMVFANPEDVAGNEKAKINFSNDNVERVRRCHQNDIENIFPFVFLSGIYVAAASPSLFAAKCVFMGFTVSRFVHTFVYLNQVPQPSRALAFMVGLGINFYMIYCIISGNL